MFDNNLYKKTFSELRASEDTLSEVMKMTARRKRISAKALLIAAAIAAALITTAFAYSDTIMQFLFGDSTARQVVNTEKDSSSTGMEILNRLEAPEADLSMAVNRDSFDDVRPFVPYGVYGPSYVPGEGHWEVSAFHGLIFSHYRDENSNSIRFLQFYAGPDAYISLTTTDNIHKVMVGDIEATAVISGMFEVAPIHLYWMKYDMVFELFSSAYDLDTLIAIAESV